MGKFIREINDSLISNLKKEKLFEEKLLPDIKKGDVFPAIRENCIDFYYYNSKLFEYDGTFKTHPKFAFVPEKYGTQSISQNDEIPSIANFYNGYENIKERAKLYSSLEAMGVYDICKRGNIYNNDEYIVLDIEVAFTEQTNDTNIEPEGTINQLEHNRKQNRIDVLLYNIKERNLLFVEAKHFINKEIRSSLEPDVVNQINRYNDIIENRKDEIIKAYSTYIENMNEIFELNLPTPETISEKCGLIIFGFDNDQKNGKLEESIIVKLKQADVKVYAKGDTKNISVKTLYETLN